MPRISEWFPVLTGLIRSLEAEAGHGNVVSQIVTDSFPRMKLSAISTTVRIPRSTTPLREPYRNEPSR